VIRAFVFLYGTSLRNALVQRVRRLRQPKYLVGAVVGGLYFYYFFFRHAFQSFRPVVSAPAAAATTTGFLSLVEPLAATGLLIIVVLSWIVPNRRAALQFSEAEVAFLFPAPISRRSLINFRLLRSQLGIFVSAFFLTLVFRRATVFGGNQLAHAAGWWLLLSILNLHFLAASFARDRLLEFGLNPWRRRLLVGGLFLAVALGCWLIVRRTVPLPTESDLANFQSVTRYVGEVLGRPPIPWVLAPFTLVVRPYLAASVSGFFAAFGPAVLLLLLHYFWVMRSAVSFEEASIDLAARRAEKVAAIRAGRWRGGNSSPGKPRSEPFQLAPRGWVPLAFLWKNLIGLGKFFRLRTWLLACAVAVLVLTWLATERSRFPALTLIGSGALMLGGWLFVFGPMFMRREVQQTLTHLDITKAFPLAGWQIVIGQLLTPMVLMTFGEWLLLLIAALALGTTTHNLRLAVVLGSVGAAGIALVLPPLCGLMLCIPYTGVLYFPAWAQSSGARGGGVEVMGQRLIFLAGYLVVLVVAVLPAAAVGALVFFIVNAFVGQIFALILTAVFASLVLSAELVAAVYWLGGKVERFDLSTELPR
jgi:hypothetical protein